MRNDWPPGFFRKEKRSGDESDVSQALIDKKSAKCLPCKHNATRVVPRLRSSLSFLTEGMAGGAFCMACNKQFFMQGKDLIEKMEWTGLNELREKYLSFFESKGHLRLPSFSLIPKNDNSLLLINSGMAPMKKYFTGEITPPRKRVTTCQKCIRTPDIERVGITARHGTFFEMLGNFSFGDYFKHEATAWAWEFLTKTLEMDVDRLWVSIYEDDDEAFRIWTEEVGVAPERIVRLGKEDNFWEHGEGPCGPCSEIYFDRGEEYGCGKDTCGVGCDCDRYVEIWNNVFTQFDSDGKGTYTPLDHPNIDTGMGLERLACVVQGVDNLFLVDTVQNIMKHISEIANVKYGDDPKTDISLRVITDHIRSTTFMIGDGVMPSNNGRGYVLRRLLRRAARHGRLLGIDRMFLTEVCDTVIRENESAYPELKDKRDFIHNVIATEEANFAKTIDQGMKILEDFVADHDGDTLSGEAAFKLQDTYGFPIDLTVEILADKGMKVDVDSFRQIYNDYRVKTKMAGVHATTEAWKGDADLFKDMEATEFLGYTEGECEAKVLAIVSGGELTDSASEGEEAIIVLDRTVCYAESGGQVGDIGTVSGEGLSVTVENTTKNNAGVFLHTCKVTEGQISVGNTVRVAYDNDTRMATRRNHTAAHLLQAALRQVLGTHVEQAGQLVNSEAVRFDFTHFSALTAEELAKVEALVNAEILSAVEVINVEMPIEEAKKLGAMALFGEKYGDMVRVVRSADDFSIEFCGGTHVDNAAKLGLFKIRSESSVAAGVRRIEAVTGANVLAMLNEALATISDTAAAMKLNNPAELVSKGAAMTAQLKEKDRQIEQLSSKLAGIEVEALVDNAITVGETKLIVKKFEGVKPDELRTMGDKVRDKCADSVAVFASVNGEKASIFVAVGKDALAKGANAGKIVKAVAQVTGGNGGGKPDNAMAGAKDLARLDEALAKAQDIVAEFLNA
jgi:alanine--tRNA ligase